MVQREISMTSQIFSGIIYKNGKKPTILWEKKQSEEDKTECTWFLCLV